jgi:hypothetical protein
MKYLQTQLWIRPDLELEKLCNLLQQPLKLNEFDLDFENVYEWGEALAQDGAWKINISRKSYCGEVLPDETYHILLAGNPPDPDKIAQQIANTLNCQVSLGKIIYLGDDDYQYESLRSFISEQNKIL